MSISGKTRTRSRYRTISLSEESFYQDFVEFAKQTMLCKNMEIDMGEFPKCADDYIRKEKPYTCWIAERYNYKPGDYKYSMVFFFNDYIYVIKFYRNGRPFTTCQKYRFMKNESIPALKIGIIYTEDLMSELNNRT